MPSPPLISPAIRPPRSFEAVARQIAALIRDEYAVGERLPAERILAERFGVSRPTLREAILSLQMTGMVQVRDKSGAYVLRRDQPASSPEIQGFGPFENLQARQMIEPQIAALAAQHATPLHLAQLAETLAAMRRDHAGGREADVPDHQFHTILAEMTGNGVLVSLCDQLWRGQIDSRIWQELHLHMEMERYRPVWLTDHEAIFRRVERKEPKHASAAMVRHLVNIRNALMTTSRSDHVVK